MFIERHLKISSIKEEITKICSNGININIRAKPKPFQILKRIIKKERINMYYYMVKYPSGYLARWIFQDMNNNKKKRHRLIKQIAASWRRKENGGLRNRGQISMNSSCLLALTFKLENIFFNYKTKVKKNL